MANSVYKTATVHLIDGTPLYLTPLTIFYLRKFMDEFANLDTAKTEDEKLTVLVACVAAAMEQYYPEIATPEAVEDSIDMSTMYKIVEIAGGIDFAEAESSQSSTPPSEGNSWDTLDLVRLESKALLLGIWKSFHELETSVSMPELIAILEAGQESDHADKKFYAALQGVDLDKETGSKDQDAWEKMKERVFGKTQANADPNDITNLKGQKAAEAGFGIGMGLNYEKIG